jgi:hypothetical protein
VQHITIPGLLPSLHRFLNCSTEILETLEEQGITAALIAPLSDPGSLEFAVLRDIFGLFSYLLERGAPSAVSAVEALTRQFSPLARPPDRRRYLVLKFLVSTVQHCGFVLVENGTLRYLIRCSIEFEPMERSQAMQILCQAAEFGFISQELRPELLAFIHRTLTFDDGLAQPNCRVLGLNILAELVRQDLENCSAVVGMFPPAEIASFFGDGAYDEKLAAAELVTAFLDYIEHEPVSSYLLAMNAVEDLTDFLGAEFSIAFCPILSAIRAVIAKIEQGSIHPDFVQNFREIVTSDFFVDLVQDLATTSPTEEPAKVAQSLLEAITQ